MPEFGEFRRQPTKSWKKEDDHSGMTCYLGMSGRLTIRDIVDHFAEHYPHVDPMDLRLNYATAVWDEAATDDDIARRKAQRADYARKTEEWEREQLAKLTKKYGVP